MSWGAVAGGAIAAVGGIASSMSGGSSGGSSSSSSTVVPAPMDSFGRGTDEYIRSIWKTGIEQLLDASESSLTEGDSQNAILGDLLNSLSSIYGNSINSSGSITDAYTNRLNELSQPAFNIGIGGQQLGIVPQRNTMLADMAKNVYSAGINQTDTERQLNTELAKLLYEKESSNTETQNTLAGLETIWPYLETIQSLRFGLPSTTTTQEASYSPSIFESLGQGVQLYNTLSDLWKGVSSSYNSSSSTGQYPYDAGL